MALSDDQRRLLKLLAKQDEAYEAIAAATGADVEELKAKAAGAIEELEKNARDEGARDEGVRAAGPVAAEASPPADGRQRSQSQGKSSGSSVRLPGNRRFAELIGG
ncbi:MAG TPA: hypothetical protein VFU04_01500, partial [Solirubrobacterales bacterium]|nr:hypothetical protein [Solirubrobacterales bacterium]